MPGLSFYARFPTVLCIAFAAGLLQAAPVFAQGQGPFAQLAGGWNGGGTITIGQNPSERIRCRATYDVGHAGTTVVLHLRCASDSYTFELQGDARSEKGEVLGDWQEKTRGAAGMISGKVKGDRVDVRVEGQTFSAVLSVVTRGDRQSISIQAPVGAQMSSASITLNRRG